MEKQLEFHWIPLLQSKYHSTAHSDNALKVSVLYCLCNVLQNKMGEKVCKGQEKGAQI